MTDVLEEVTSANITQDHVRRRVEDWSRRIDEFYGQVEDWLPSGWSAERRRTVSMQEQMMREFGVPGRRLPILDLRRDDGQVASIEPRGLWIVGVNGRLDLRRRGGQFVIVDTADNFARPRWEVAAASDRGRAKTFDREALLEILA